MNVIITGASKGIGYATALAFARQGHTVWALARNAELLDKLKGEAANLEGQVLIKPCDVSEFDVSWLPDSMKPVDILIHNAGKLVNKPFAEITRQELKEVYEVNVFAPFYMTQQLMPVLANKAHIINVSSVGGVTGTIKFPGLSAYSSSKAAMSCLSECWHAEFADTELSFNSLALGSVQTEMLEAAFPGYRAAASAGEMAEYLVDFALKAPGVIKGKTQLVSSTNP